MARKNVRVDIPIGNVDRTVKLGETTSARHTALGAGSPLTGQMDMAIFDALVANIKAARGPAISDARQKEAWNEQALTVIGIAAGQNLQSKKTVYWHINQVQKFMAFKFKGNEEQASLWGFNVVVSDVAGRRYVNFNVPYNSPEGLLDLGSAIISKHNTDGAGSIFTAPLFDMADFEAKVNQARTLRDDALAKDQTSQASYELARNLCGYGEGQSSETPETLYYLITQVRDLLLVAYDGNEEQLSTFGFNVVVSTSTSSGGGDTPEPPSGVSISGRATDSSANPLSDVDVRIYSVNSGPGADDPVTVTDANGNFNFEFPSIPEAIEVVIEGKLSGYSDASRQLFVEAGQTYTNQDLIMTLNP